MIPWCLPTKEITYLTGRNFPFTKFNPKHSLVCESTLREQLSQKLRPGHPWVTLSSFLPNIRSRNICKICRQGRESPGSTNWNAFTILVLRSFVGIKITDRQNVDIQKNLPSKCQHPNNQPSKCQHPNNQPSKCRHPNNWPSKCWHKNCRQKCRH
jgi:hypothetical protein